MERRAAFEVFYRRERAGVLRALAYALEDRELAVECVDEAMVRAFERWDSVADMGNPTGWVFRVASNLARNRWRRLKLERRKPALPDPQPADVEGVSDPAIARALTQLPVDQRMVVVLRFHLDWSLEQIAEAVGHPIGTVKSRLHRALGRLETLLEEPS